jgi:hypothetical protein
MEDGALPHWSRYTQDAKRKFNLPSLRRNDWPAVSPDLNPLDFFLWGYLKREVDLCFFYIFICYLQVYRGVPPTTAQQLEVRI